MRGYLPLIWKNSSTHMHGLTVYVKEGLPFAWDLSLENCRFLLIFSTDYTSLSVLLLFLLLTTFLSLCMVFDSISSNIDEVLSINQSANVFFFGDFNEHHKDLLTNSGRTEDLVISVIIFLSQMTLLRWLTCLLGSQTVIFTILLFWIYFF